MNFRNSIFIKETYTLRLHHINHDNNVYITVCKLNSITDATMYCKSSDYSYKDFCDLIWASTLVPALFEPFTKDGIDYADGGITENLGVNKAIELGCTEIDAYLHITKQSGYKEVGKNWLHNAIRAAILQRDEVVINDLNLNNKNINLHYLPKKLEGAGIMEFNPIVMKKWFSEGYDYERK